MSFQIGDRVRIIPGTEFSKQSTSDGIISSVLFEEDGYTWVNVKFDDRTDNNYRIECDLEFADGYVPPYPRSNHMPEPEMALDEIEQAQALMEELK